MQLLINLKIKWSGSDVIVTPIEPPVVEPPVIVPPIENGFKNITEEWYSKLSNPLVTEIVIDGKCRVDNIKAVTITRKLTIKGINNATILFGKEYYNPYKDEAQDWNLITLDNNAEVVIEDVNLCIPKQTPRITTYLPTIFKSLPNHNSKWNAVVKNCDTTILGNNGGMGLGLVYGSAEGNYIGAINFKHVGVGFVEAKASIGGTTNGILYLVLENVSTDGTLEGTLNTHKTKVKGIFNDGSFKITSNHDVTAIYNHFYNSDASDNYAHILHVGRFTFMLLDNCDDKNKTYKLRPNAKGTIRIRVVGGKLYTPNFESHAGDSFTLNSIKYNIIEKGRDEHPFWSNNFNAAGSELSYHPYCVLDKSLTDGEYFVNWSSSFNLIGTEEDTWILYKDSRFGFRSYPNTLFENYEIMNGDAVGHSMYNHAEISLWAKDVIQKGYYRQTSREGKTLGYNMINCTGFKDEFKPPVQVTTNIPMPDRIKKLI
jgi:hypothetical protein